MQLEASVTQAMLDAIDAAIGATGFFRLYDGDPDVAGTIVASCAMNNPAFGAAAGTSPSTMGMATATAVQDTGPSAGTVDYAGLYASTAATAGAWLAKLGVATGGTPDLTMANNTVATTDTVQITSFTISMPAGSVDST